MSFPGSGAVPSIPNYTALEEELTWLLHLDRLGLLPGGEREEEGENVPRME